APGQTPLQVDDRQAGAYRFPALIPAVRRGARQRLCLVLNRQDAVSNGDAVANRQILEPLCALGTNMVIMRRLAADHTAERDKSVEAAARARDDGNRSRDLERSRNRNAFMGGADLGERALSAAAEFRGDVSVVGGLDKQDMGRLCHG